MLPSRDEAERILSQSEKMNPGRWGIIAGLLL